MRFLYLLPVFLMSVFLLHSTPAYAGGSGVDCELTPDDWRCAFAQSKPDPATNNPGNGGGWTTTRSRTWATPNGNQRIDYQRSDRGYCRQIMTTPDGRKLWREHDGDGWMCYSS
ncbi:MAG: hypothetical protein AB7G80_06530 [Dongiaceae bacterium]